MNVKVPEVLFKKYFRGKEQQAIEELLTKALVAWFAAEDTAAFFGLSYKFIRCSTVFLQVPALF